MKFNIYLVVVLLYLLPAITHAQKDKHKLDFDLMTKKKCKAINSILLSQENLPFDEFMEKEKTFTYKVINDIACITKVGNKIAGIYFIKGFKIITVDSTDYEKALDTLENTVRRTK